MPLEHDAWRACIAALAPEALTEVDIPEVIDLRADAAWAAFLAHHTEWSRAVS
jgi:hypothetical protein